MKKILILIGLLIFPACNFAPDALLGDTNAKAWGSDYEYNYSYGSSSSSNLSGGAFCETREIRAQSGGNESCSVPGALWNRAGSITAQGNRIFIDLRKEAFSDDFQIASLLMTRQTFSGYGSSYSTVTATCTEDKSEARPFDTRYVCTVPESRFSKTDRFRSMTIVNSRCDCYTNYTLPESCNPQAPYQATYGGNHFPEL